MGRKIQLLNMSADQIQTCRKTLRREVMQAESEKIEFCEIQGGGSCQLEHRKSAVTSKLIDPYLAKFHTVCLSYNNHTRPRKTTYANLFNL
jgi:hypothetical protein